MQPVYFELNLDDYVGIDITGREFVISDKKGNKVIIKASERVFNTIGNALKQHVEELTSHDWRRADGTDLFVCTRCRKVSLGRDVTKCIPMVHGL